MAGGRIDENIRWVGFKCFFCDVCNISSGIGVGKSDTVSGGCQESGERDELIEVHLELVD